MTKLAVYAICKNEEGFVDRWMDSMAEADAVYVLDTGSTDGTVEKLRARGAIVESHVFDPWRFDDARNASLDMVPQHFDICACIDLDEVLTKGWVDALKASWAAGRMSGVNRFRYKYVWSHTPEGKEGTTYWADKIHARESHLWVGPVHETMRTRRGIREEQLFVQGFQIDHWPDNTKSRGSYLPLLELAVKEDPLNDRNMYYLGREYMYKGRLSESIATLKRYLDLPTASWNAERSRAMQYIGQMTKNKPDAERWLIHACYECPDMREPWVALAWHFYISQRYDEALLPVTRYLSVTNRPMTYICDPLAWGWEVLDLAAMVYWKTGQYEKALPLAERAAEENPAEARLKKNAEEMRRVMSK